MQKKSYDMQQARSQPCTLETMMSGILFIQITEYCCQLLATPTLRHKATHPHTNMFITLSIIMVLHITEFKDRSHEYIDCLENVFFKIAYTFLLDTTWLFNRDSVLDTSNSVVSRYWGNKAGRRNTNRTEL